MELTAESLAALAARPEVVAEFPFLRTLTRVRKAAAGRCGGCAPPAGGSWKAIAAAIFQLPPDRRAVFKTLAGVDHVTRRVTRYSRTVTESF